MNFKSHRKLKILISVSFALLIQKTQYFINVVIRRHVINVVVYSEMENALFVEEK